MTDLLQDTLLTHPQQAVTREQLLDRLFTEREYHATHPTETYGKFWYTLGGTFTTIVLAFAFQDKIDPLKRTLAQPHGPAWILSALALVVVGYVLVVKALDEHSSLHKAQLDKLEDAIAYLLNPANDYDYASFWKRYGEAPFAKTRWSDIPAAKLFTKEPDTRRGLRFHDRKMEAGFLIIVAGILVLLFAII